MLNPPPPAFFFLRSPVLGLCREPFGPEGCSPSGEHTRLTVPSASSEAPRAEAAHSGGEAMAVGAPDLGLRGAAGWEG